MTDDDDKQLDLFFKVRTDFFTILNTIIDTGEMAKIGTDAMCILLVLRRYTKLYDKKDPFTKISHDKISEFTGLSKSTVQRKIKILEENGYVRIVQRGFKKRNQYVLTEKMLAVSQSETEEDKLLTMDFVPFLMQQRKREIKHFEKHGELPVKSPIRIESINLEFNNNINITVNNNYGDSVNISSAQEDFDPSILPKWVQEKILPRIKEDLDRKHDELTVEIKKVMDEASKDDD